MSPRRIIVDFTTPEVVRGSFGYDGYLLYSYWKGQGVDVEMIEDGSPFKFHRTIPDDALIYSLYWSYGQKDIQRWLYRNYPNVSYFGYYPMIEADGLPIEYFSDDNVVDGMADLPKYVDEFNYGILSDCDLHLKSSDRRKTIPVFFSYGCPNQCYFCPIPPNREFSSKKRLTVRGEDIDDMCETIYKKDVNVHICDEDFFIDARRAKTILETIATFNKKNGELIALGSIPSVERFVSLFGEQPLIDAGLRLIEIGLETPDEELRKKMNKTGDMTDVDKILERTPSIRKLWLTVSLFPGETIESVRTAGQWYAKNGIPADQLNDRIMSGSTGGLGQFYQVYDGAYMPEADIEGISLTDRPIRLIPSFIPDSILYDEPIEDLSPCDELRYWWKKYNIRHPAEHYLRHINGKNTVLDIIQSNRNLTEGILAVLLMARFQVIA